MMTSTPFIMVDNHLRCHHGQQPPLIAFTMINNHVHRHHWDLQDHYSDIYTFIYYG